jgi:hypothetical protein
VAPDAAVVVAAAVTAVAVAAAAVTNRIRFVALSHKQSGPSGALFYVC